MHSAQNVQHETWSKCFWFKPCPGHCYAEVNCPPSCKSGTWHIGKRMASWLFTPFVPIHCQYMYNAAVSVMLPSECRWCSIWVKVVWADVAVNKTNLYLYLLPVECWVRGEGGTEQRVWGHIGRICEWQGITEALCCSVILKLQGIPTTHKTLSLTNLPTFLYTQQNAQPIYAYTQKMTC